MRNKQEVIPSGYLFTNKMLWGMILPLIAEQFLNIFIGLSDSIMVATAGEAAVSAVSLVDSVMILLVNVFTAVSTGGGIIAGQMIGMKRKDKGCEVTEQTLFFTLGLSFVVMAVMYLGRELIFIQVFGQAEAAVLSNAKTYYMIMSASVPFLALYNVGASTYRVMGNAKLPMFMSLVMNIIHFVGNYLLIYVLHMGIAGAGISSLLSRAFAGILMIRFAMRKENAIHIRTLRIKPASEVIRKIMTIAIPFGVENSLFQLGKILVLSLVTGLGTAAITANAVASNVGSFAVLIGSSMAVALSIVAAQSVGVGEFEQVRFYTRKIMKNAYLILLIVNILIILSIPLLVRLYQLSNETEDIVRQLLMYHSVCVVLLWPASFMLPPTLRAANDVKYCMVIAVCSMWIFRIGFSYLLVQGFQLGILGVWIAMSLDWGVRAIFYVIRYRGKKWESAYLAAPPLE